MVKSSQIMSAETIELSRGDLREIYPFFERGTSLCVDSVSIQKISSGEIGTKAIGTWVIPKRITEDHFKDFEDSNSREVVDLRLIPGHFWAEALGQTLGALVYSKYPDHLLDILPIFAVASTRYKEAAFLGDRVNLCVELIGELEQERGKTVVIHGRGAAVFNERTLAVCDPITVNMLSLDTATRALRMLEAKHKREPWVAASFDNFSNYFVQ